MFNPLSLQWYPASQPVGVVVAGEVHAWPRGHKLHVESSIASVATEYVPAGHGTCADEEEGQ